MPVVVKFRLVAVGVVALVKPPMPTVTIVPPVPPPTTLRSPAMLMIWLRPANLAVLSIPAAPPVSVTAPAAMF